MFSLVKRNLLYTVRDRMTFLMSFLSVVILIIVYKSFLGQFQIDELKKAAMIKSVPAAGIEMVNFWLIAGLVVVTTVTSTLNALNVVVDDYVTGKKLDFKIAGASPLKVALSYYLSAIILGFAVTLACLVVGIVIFVDFAAISAITLVEWMQLCGYILLSTILAVLLVMPIVELARTRNSFSSFSTIIGTLVGFVAGIYIAIGNVGAVVKNIMLGLPLIHETTLFKSILMNQSETKFFANFPEHAQTTYDKIYGNQLYFPNSSQQITLNDSLLFILAWIFGLVVINILVHNFVLKKRA